LVDDAVNATLGLPVGCYALDQPGNWDPTCPPAVVHPLQGGDVSLAGCCNTLTSTCGIALDNDLMAIIAGPNLGCMATGDPTDGSAKSCTPSSADGGSLCPPDPVTIATEQVVSDIAVDATNVYWLTPAAVMKMTLDGGPATKLMVWGGDAMTLDATHVYWSNSSTVAKLPLGGGTPTTLAYEGSKVIAVDDTSVYWAAGTSLKKAPLAGGAPTVLASVENAVAIVVDAEDVYWMDVHPPPAPNCPDSICPRTATLWKLPLAGGSPTALATNQTNPTPLGMVADANNVYWVGAHTSNGAEVFGVVMKVAKAGGEPTTLAPGHFVPVGVAVDATNVYWATRAAEGHGGAVMKAPIEGGPAIMIACAQQPTRIAADAKNLYWANEDGRISKLPK
jgi:hypothetical protein